MKIFLAGATGALGKRLVPQLISRGHHVVGTTRTEAKAEMLLGAGAEPIVLDALDRAAVLKAVTSARPDAIVHQMTALASMKNFKNFDKEFALTNRLRTEGREYLLAAAQAAGAQRFIAQSYTGWPNERAGGRIKTEDDPLDPHPPKAAMESLAAIRGLEAMVLDASGIILRYGGFYGPGTSLSADGESTQLVRERKFPIVGNGAGVWSFIHIEDAATATRLAIEDAPSGIYNVVDDEPAEVSVWLPELAKIIGARPPRHVPEWLGRLAIGETGVSMMTEIRGSSNAKAKRILGWEPRYASWRAGFTSI